MKPPLLTLCDPPRSSLDAFCADCHSRVEGKFCSNCGASTTVEVPSAGEFLHEFIGHYVALEGKLLKTLKLLLFRPGRLTLDYLAGRRMAFISPLRLYLTLSIVVFALIRIYGIELPQVTIEEDSFGATYRHAVGTKFAKVKINFSEGEAATGAAVLVKMDTVAPSEVIAGAIAGLGRINQQWMENLKEFVNAPASEKGQALNHGFVAYLPYMLISALPLFALYLKLIFFRSARRYGEHLVFALHTSAFAFLIASIMIILPGNVGWLFVCLFYDGMLGLISVWDCLQVLPFVWLLLYLPAAMQCVYGGGRLATTGRWIVVISAHLLTISTLTILAELIGIITRG